MTETCMHENNIFVLGLSQFPGCELMEWSLQCERIMDTRDVTGRAKLKNTSNKMKVLFACKLNKRIVT